MNEDTWQQKVHINKTGSLPSGNYRTFDMLWAIEISLSLSISCTRLLSPVTFHKHTDTHTHADQGTLWGDSSVKCLSRK